MNKYNLKNLVVLSVLGAICGGAWGYWLLKSIYVDSLFSDSRIGFVFFWGTPWLVFALCFQLRTARMILWYIFNKVRIHPLWVLLVVCLNLISCASLTGTTIFAPESWLVAVGFFPGFVVALVIGLYSMINDIEKADEIAG